MSVPTGPVASMVILTEGPSDRAALMALADRKGLDLARRGVEIVAMGGATNARAYFDRYGAREIPIACLGDIGEAGAYAVALFGLGFRSPPSVVEMRRAGVHFCDVDLEDELIRALGNHAAREIADDPTTPGTFRSYQRQPAHRGEDLGAQLRGFVTNWKVEYARLFVEALDLSEVPEPLEAVLAEVIG